MASQLAFGMLARVSKAPEHHDVLNPYITILLSFLDTVSQQPKALALLERSVLWELLANFLAQVPRHTLKFGLTKPTLGSKTWLPEDWCIRDNAWGGRRLYHPGYWKSGEDKTEMEVLDEVEERHVYGMIEDDHDEDDEQRVDEFSMPDRRWLRAFWAGERLVAVEKGFVFAESQGRGQWSVEGDLAEKVHVWAEEDRAEREEEERRKRGTRWGDDSMEIDDDGLDGAEESSEQSEEDESDSEEVKALKARRRYLRSLLQSSEQDSSFELIAVRPRGSRKPAAPRRSLKLVPGYTILVVDTNILLSSLPMLASLIKSMHWTVVVPLPVIMELDGLATNESALGEAAKDALAFLVSHVRSHETSLKVQTSKGNYLSTLSVRTEQVDFDNPESWERNMDDLILKAAIWQDEHWADRSAFLSVEPQNTASAAKVVLLSLDRNLRLKARSRQLDAANEKDLAALLASARQMPLRSCESA
ncbi:hypothetical protein EW146_g4142 [Bondarzewia mesenterica]|uniref:PIN domain-containing protein n=1 Tax=Bondarzewia mesenterica TaxID=1095465 RepID=A0A4S4LVD3_9AGAM|nr:hypothetical protein EW146_g4142 [Bondarzewia mesenterica]